MNLRPPCEAASEDEARQVYNDDLSDLCASELAIEIRRAALLVSRAPRAIVWRGRTPIPVRVWADERIAAAFALLSPQPAPRQKARAKPWR